jgi:hypothetical protein
VDPAVLIHGERLDAGTDLLQAGPGAPEPTVNMVDRCRGSQAVGLIQSLAQPRAEGPFEVNPHSKEMTWSRG